MKKLLLAVFAAGSLMITTHQHALSLSPTKAAMWTAILACALCEVRTGPWTIDNGGPVDKFFNDWMGWTRKGHYELLCRDNKRLAIKSDDYIEAHGHLGTALSRCGKRLLVLVGAAEVLMRLSDGVKRGLANTNRLADNPSQLFSGDCFFQSE